MPAPQVPDRLFINGEWVAPAAGASRPSVDPFTSQPWATLPEADEADVRRAVKAAGDAFDGDWGRISGRDRRKLLLRIAEAISDRAEELALTESYDNGKLLREMRGQLDGLPDWYEFYAGLADKVRGATVPLSKSDFFGYTLKEPAGVCAAITAWNSPLLLLTWKLAPALAAGCTMVVKPSEHASASTLAFGRVLEEAGVPAGVVNIVTGGPQTGRALVGDPRVAKVSFTGSVDVGAQVGQAAIGDLKRVTLELGGKSPNIVFDDAPLDDAVNGAVAGIFAATGQTCAAGSRVLVHKDIHDEFTAALVERAAGIRLGDPLAEDTQMGPVAFQAQLEKVQHYIAIASDEGAELLSGGHRPNDAGLENGLFIEPTVLGHVDNRMRIARGGGLRACCRRDPLQRRGRRNSAGQRLVLWSRRRCLDRQRRPRAPHGEGVAGGHGVGQRLSNSQLRDALRRFRCEWHRSGERYRGDRGLLGGQSRLDQYRRCRCDTRPVSPGLVRGGRNHHAYQLDS